MPVSMRWFPPAWFHIGTKDKLAYVDPAYLSSYFTNYPKRIEFSKWPDPIDGLPEELEKADLIFARGLPRCVMTAKAAGQDDVQDGP